MSIIDSSRTIEIHDTIIRETGGENGVLNLSLLDVCIDKPELYIFRIELFPDIFQKAAALMHCIILFHPFVDGNKRTGIVMATIFLENNSYSLNYDQNEIVDFTKQIAIGECEILEIAQWLLGHSTFTPPE